MKEINRLSHHIVPLLPTGNNETRIVHNGENWNSFLRNLDFGQYEQNIPLELMEQMFEDLDDISIIRRHAFCLKTSRNIISLPCDVNCNYNIDWASDTNKVKPDKWIKLDIPTYMLNASMIMTQDLMEDVEDIIYKRIINRMTQVENLAFLYGDGKIKPTGLLHEINKVKKIEIDMENLNMELLASAYMELGSAFQQNSVWLVNKKFFNFLVNYDKKNLFINVPNYNSSTIRFLNSPLYVVDQLQDDHFALIGDLGQSYCIVDRSDLTVFKDPYSQKPDIEFYFSKRMGGMPMNFNSYILIRKKTGIV